MRTGVLNVLSVLGHIGHIRTYPTILLLLCPAVPTAALVAPPAKVLHFLLQENAAGADGAAAVLVHCN